MTNESKICLYCKNDFIKKRKDQIFCCHSCAVSYHNAKRKPLKDKKNCVICGKEFYPWNKNQVTCGRKECVKTNSNNNKKKKKKRGAYLYAKNGGLKMPPSPPKKKVKPWDECTPSERWERMSLTELSREIARLYPGKSFGQVRILKEQGLLSEDFGKGCNQ